MGMCFSKANGPFGTAREDQRKQTSLTTSLKTFTFFSSFTPTFPSRFCSQTLSSCLWHPWMPGHFSTIGARTHEVSLVTTWIKSTTSVLCAREVAQGGRRSLERVCSDLQLSGRSIRASETNLFSVFMATRTSYDLSHVYKQSSQ